MRRTGPTAGIGERDLPAAGEARDRFERWLSGAPGAPSLLAALEARGWRDAERTEVGWENRAGKWHHSEVFLLWRLAPEEVARVRATAIAAIEAAGGRVELGGTVATVAAGELRMLMT